VRGFHEGDAAGGSLQLGGLIDEYAGELYADFHSEYGLNLVEIIVDWDEPGPCTGPGRYYSPRLLLSLISELSLDSRFVSAQRPGDYREWRMWASSTFQ